MMEAVIYRETSLIYQTARRNIPEHDHVHTRLYEIEMKY
jgi:hypothetical protein